MSTSLHYRPEVDGLRALAVLPVVFFHAGFHSFSGGFIGVDVFFVISGYLITSIIYNDIRSDRFSIVRFYERRIRRIFPALMLVAIFSFIFARMLMFNAEMVEYSHSLVSVNLFVSNILFWMQSGYFESSSELKPLLHTWSLSVEEQFYIFFPILLFLLRKKSFRFIMEVICGITAISLGLAEVASRTSPNANFFLLPTRAWELGTGALLAIYSTTGINLGKAARQVLSALGIIMISLAIFLLDGSIRYPSLWGLIPVAGTTLVLLATTPETVVGKVLSWRPIVFTGLMSYSIYLWHQPIFAFYRMYYLGEPPLINFLALIGVTIILAALTWRFVEQPFRKGVFHTRKSLFGTAAGLSAVLIVIGEVSAITTGSLGLEVARERLDRGSYAKADPQSASYSQGAATGAVVLWGDSFADAISVSLKNDMKANNIPFEPFIFHSCPSLMNTRRNEDYRLGARFSERCLDYNHRVAETIKILHPSVVVLANHYLGYVDNINPYNGRPILLPEVDNGESGLEIVLHSLNATVHFLEGIGSKVIILAPYPILDNYQNRRRRYEKLGGNSAIFDLDRAPTDDLEAKLIRAAPGAIEVNIIDLLCKHDHCSAIRDDGSLLLFDGTHVSTTISPIIANRITAKVIGLRKEETDGSFTSHVAHTVTSPAK